MGTDVTIRFGDLSAPSRLARLGRSEYPFVINLVEQGPSVMVELHENLLFTERKYKAVWEHASDAMLFVDQEGILDCNDAAVRMLGASCRESLVGETLSSFAPPLQPDGIASSRWIGQQVLTALEGSPVRFECHLLRQNGARLVVDIRLHAIALGGGYVAHGVMRDITSRWEAERRLTNVKDAIEVSLHQLSYFDSVTDLPNRIQFLDRGEALLRHAEEQGRSVVMLGIGVNELKKINYSLGLNAGDSVLRQMAARIEQVLEPEDLIARISGNEFGLLLDRCTPEGATVIAQRIVAQAASPIQVMGHEVSVSISIGIGIFGDDARDLPTLMQQAEAALYRGKAGGEPIRVYGEAITDSGLEFLTLENALRLALEREEFVLHYQPLIEVSSGRITGVEALVRWAHPERGLLLPSAFIPLAEQTGQIVPLGDWVMRQACRQAGKWQAMGLASIEMSINLAPRQFRKDTLLSMVSQALAESGLSSRCLVLELTEGALMENTERTLRVLCELQAMGVRLAIDDFGTGYSSLAYLQRFPIHRLKMDQSFVRDIGRAENDVVIARAIVNLARDLRLNVVAEGIETADEMEALRAYGCETMQGYYFARPMPAEEIERLLLAG